MSFNEYRLGLTGYPLDHSISPALHKAALAATGLKGEYNLYPVPMAAQDETGLAVLMNRIRSGEFHGLNVTVPHKQAVIPYLDELTPAAQCITAVNTIYLREGKVIGDNTDAPGFLMDLERLQVDSSGTALVLGAGGSARAIVFALLTSGWQVTVAARRIEQADELVAGFIKTHPNLNAKRLDHSVISKRRSKINLVVNCTPVGMWPEVDTSPWPDGIPLPQGASVYDLVYNPPQTRLIRQAGEAGLPARGGLGMLVEQAALAFERWTGVTPQREAMWQAAPKAWKVSSVKEGDL